MRLFLELLNVCKSCTGSGMQNERQIYSKETACWNSRFLLGVKLNAPLAVKCTQHRRLGVYLRWEFGTRDF